MLQPFERLTLDFVERLEKLGKVYFVTQFYPRGFDHFTDEVRTSILVSVYEDLGLAKTHLNAVKADRYGAIIRLDRPQHRLKLIQMVSGQTRFEVYWAVVRDAAMMERRLKLKYKDHIHRYVEQRTNWSIGRDATLPVSVQLIFGELYINLKWGSQLVRVKFEEIEKS